MGILKYSLKTISSSNYSSFKGSSFKQRSEAQSLLSFITQEVTPVYPQTYSTLHPKYTAKQKKMYPSYRVAYKMFKHECAI